MVIELSEIFHESVTEFLVTRTTVSFRVWAFGGDLVVGIVLSELSVRLVVGVVGVGLV